MSLIKFNQDITLAFITADNQEVERKSFSAGEFAEFALRADGGVFTLTSADGSYAPWVGGEAFSILPEGFQLYRFTQSVSLSFATLVSGTPVWEDGQRYEQNSVHVFKVEIGKYGDYALRTPLGRLIPGVPPHLIERIGSSAPLASRSTDNTPKQVLEAFPAPVPGTQFGNSWELPGFFNSLRVIRDEKVHSSLFHCSETPVAYLRLVEGDGHRYDRLYYRCSFFGVPRRKVAKV